MARACALRVLTRIDEQGAFSHIALHAELERSQLKAKDRALATEIVYGTLTWRPTLDEMIEYLTKRSLDRIEVLAVRILRMSLYQLVFLDRVPEHAVCDEAVRLSAEFGSDALKPFINAVLREAVRQGTEFLRHRTYRASDELRKPVRYLSQRYALPSWMANRFIQIYGQPRAERVAHAYTMRPKQYLRAPALTEAEAKTCGLSAVEGVEGAWGTPKLADDGVQALIDQGHAQVQDLGSQLIVHYAQAKPGMKVLDACAGLGGKSLMLAQLVGEDGHVTAVEPLPQKLELLKARASLMGLEQRISAEICTLQEFAQRDPEARFDLVLLDAPCSALGVIRRHPETKWRREEADIPQLVTLQRELLDVAASLVAPGGMLVYSVCSFLREEGPKQITQLLERPAGARFARTVGEPVPASYLNSAQELATSPDLHGCDGFFAASLTAQPE